MIKALEMCSLYVSLTPTERDALTKLTALYVGDFVMEMKLNVNYKHVSCGRLLSRVDFMTYFSLLLTRSRHYL